MVLLIILALYFLNMKAYRSRTKMNRLNHILENNYTFLWLVSTLLTSVRWKCFMWWLSSRVPEKVLLGLCGFCYNFCLFLFTGLEESLRCDSWLNLITSPFDLPSSHRVHLIIHQISIIGIFYRSTWGIWTFFQFIWYLVPNYWAWHNLQGENFVNFISAGF